MRRLCFALLIATPAAAEVTSSAETGFATRHSAIVKASPAQVYAALLQPQKWWNPQHSWSGDAANLSLDPRPGGCFCEKLPGGGVEHGRVIFARPGQLLRLSAALGPLQGEGVSATLSWTLTAVPEGTRITQDYVVGGYIRGGGAKWAAPVDGVVGGQFARLVAFVG